MRFETSKKKMLLLMGGSLLFVFLGIWLVERDPLVGRLSIGFFGMCALVGAAGLLPGSSYLELNANGFLVCSLYRKWFIHWADVDEFFSIRIRPNPVVGWNYRPGHTAAIRGRRFSAAISGAESVLPDTYGMKTAELVELMNGRREQHGR